MNNKLHVIYIPGVGDARRGSAQRRLVAAWRHYGVEPEIYEMNWGDTVPWATKFQKFLSRVDELRAEGKMIGLVGASAGASAVINTYAARKSAIVGCALIAGKINRPEAIGPRYRCHNPSFVSSDEAAVQALAQLTAEDRARILSRYGLIDEVVARRDSQIPGVCNRLSPSLGHGLTIAYQISFGAPSLLRFLKHRLA